jgi:hypothetical protein
MWPAYLIEVIVIILGIGITVGLEQWRENVEDKELANSYSRNLLHNITDDRESLKYCIVQTDTVLSRLNELQAVAKAPSKPRITPTRADSDLLAVLNRRNSSAAMLHFQI